MANLTLRSVKKATLTNEEVDGNFTALNNELTTKLETSTLLDAIKTIDIDGSGINATTLQSRSSASAATPNTVVIRDGSGNFAGASITATQLTATTITATTLNLTGGIGASSISGIVSVANGGTGADNAATARTNLGLAIGTNIQPFDNDLTAVAALTTTGIIARTGDGTATTRTIQGTANDIAVANGDGISGNPTLSIGSNIARVNASNTFSSTNTFSAANTFNGANTFNAANTFSINATNTFNGANTFNAAATFASTVLVNSSVSNNIVDMGVSGTAIDCSLGNYFIKNVSSNTTFSFSNVPTTRAYSCIVEITHVSGTIAWPASVKFPNDVTTVLTVGRTHLFGFVTDDGGTRWRGVTLANYVN